MKVFFKCFKYFIYFFLIFSIIYLWGFLSKIQKEVFNFNFQVHYGYIIASLLIGVGIGIILGLEHFITEFRKIGSWKINVVKLLIAGLPSFYFSLSYMFIYSNISFLQTIIAYPMIKLMEQDVPMALFQVVLGYMIITSFYKDDDNFKNTV